jgi:hypothetical protein
MTEASNPFGILTLATPNDYLKAIGLALSLRVSNPGVPTAVACSPRVMPLVKPYFDFVVEEKAGLRGFVHKVHLDQYSPFAETVFFDSDVLVFKPLLPYVHTWGSGPYYACGGYMPGGMSSFGLDRTAVLKKLGKDTRCSESPRAAPSSISRARSRPTTRALQATPPMPTKTC